MQEETSRKPGYKYFTTTSRQIMRLEIDYDILEWFDWELPGWRPAPSQARPHDMLSKTSDDFNDEDSRYLSDIIHREQRKFNNIPLSGDAIVGILLREGWRPPTEVNNEIGALKRRIEDLEAIVDNT